MTDIGSRLARTALLLSAGMFALALALPVFELIWPMPGWFAVIVSAACLLQPSELFHRSAFFSVPQKLLLSIGWLSACVSITSFVLLFTRARSRFPLVLKVGLVASLIYAALVPVVFPIAFLHVGYVLWVSSLLLLAPFSFNVVRRRLDRGAAV